MRLTAGALIGVGAWVAVSASLPFIPVPLRFLLCWLIFTFGPGIAIAGYLTRDLDPLRRVTVVLGVGSAATPALIDALGRMHLVPAFPYVAAALCGSGLAMWRGRSAGIATSKGDLVACVALVALAIGLGAIVFGNRLVESPSAGIVLYGEYDSADISYYAAEASEATHTVPPMASYYSGHRLNAAYYPQLVLAMIHRFAAVPVMTIYFRYAWPTFLSLSALAAFALARSLASRGIAVLAVVLILVGSDFSYLAAWSLKSQPPAWDWVLWPTNFLSPTMQLLQFNTWGPSLPVFLTLLYVIVLGLQTRRWSVVSAVLLAILFQFKPFAYAILMAALAAATVFSGRDRLARWHFVATAGIGVILTLPFLLAAASLDPGDRRTRLVIEFFPLVKRMLIKLGLTETFASAANRWVPWAPLRTPLMLLVATIMFLAVGVGVRWVGAPGVWRAIRRTSGSDIAAWSLLGWAVVAGVAVPFVLATDPYVDTLQFYVTGLYLMWIFTAVALIGFARAHRRMGAVVVASAVLLTLPASTHYLARRWSDRERPPRVSLSPHEVAIAEYLRMTTDPESTVVLHDQPLSPSLITIVSERRIVLGWDVRYSAVGGEERLREVNRFYASHGGDPHTAFETLRRYRVTHVIVNDRDRVHPEVVARLKPKLQFSDVTLYEVPLESSQ